MSEVRVNKLSPRSGTTVTLGDSGDTISIPSGVTLANSGTFTNFQSTGIDDNATSTAITIDSSQNVGIGTASPGRIFEVSADQSYVSIKSTNDSTGTSQIFFGDTSDDNVGRINYDHSSNAMLFLTSATERMRIDSSGNVGIGTSSPDSALNISRDNFNSSIQTAPTNYSLTFPNFGNTGEYGNQIGLSNGTNILSSFGFVDEGAGGNTGIYFTTGNSSSQTERLRINNNGNVGIGTSSPGAKLQVESSGTTIIRITAGNSSDSQINFGDPDDGNIGMLNYDHAQNSMKFVTNNSERMRIASNGQVLVAGTTAGDSVSEIIVDNGSATSTYGFRHQGGGKYMRMGCPNSAYAYFETNSSAGFFMDGNTFVNGTLSKSSGSFKIDHPLPSKNSTHHLVHSFTESPQADLIYRGKVDLVNGTATVNIDTVAGMTEGTFVLLNRDIQCFTSNETGWIAVKGSVSGNTLTITAQDNTCDDTISWMVIGERQDQHMYDTSWTDENGKVIVEPLKETEQQP